MIRILFVCHGNICRSPMAEYMMLDYLDRKGLSDRFLISSAATSSEELGNDMYPPAKDILRRHGIPFSRRAARQISKNDYDRFDYIIGMDEYNIRNLSRYYNGDPESKIFKLMSFAGSGANVSDPWYTGDFESTYKDIEEALPGLVSAIMEEN